MAEVDCITVRKQYDKFRLLNGLHVHTGDSIVFGRARPADLDLGQITRRVLPFSSGGQVQSGLYVALVAVRRWRWRGSYIVGRR